MTYKWEESQFKAPLARARGLGSAHSGVHHWMHQKITALANIPLSLWAVWSVTKLAVAGMTYENVFGFLVQPFNAVMMLLFLLSVFYHASLGLQVVIEDYVHCEKTKMLSLIFLKLGFLVMGIASAFSVLKLAL